MERKRRKLQALINYERNLARFYKVRLMQGLIALIVMSVFIWIREATTIARFIEKFLNWIK